jgi:hypothetical protein
LSAAIVLFCSRAFSSARRSAASSGPAAIYSKRTSLHCCFRSESASFLNVLCAVHRDRPRQGRKAPQARKLQRRPRGGPKGDAGATSANTSRGSGLIVLGLIVDRPGTRCDSFNSIKAKASTQLLSWKTHLSRVFPCEYIIF